MKSIDLVDIMFSPLWVSTLLHHFFSGAQRFSSKGVKTELLYLMMPFTVDDITRDHLSNARSTSSVTSVFFNNKNLATKNSLLNKNYQVAQYRDISNRGLIYLSNVETLKIDKFITASTTIEYKKEKRAIRDFCKAAHNLGAIFVKEDYKSLFIKLGIINL